MGNTYIFNNKVSSIATWKILFAQQELVELCLCRFPPPSRIL
jgi:hypothetical protein